VVVHGWGGGAETMATLGRMVSADGYGVALLSMRGWGRSGGQDDAGLEQPDDIVDAVRALATEPWVRGGVVGLLGVSQGGQVALLAAARGAAVAAVAAWAPVTDLDRWRATTSEPGIVDYLDRTVGTDTRRRSPVDVAVDITAPVLLVHGDADERVPKEQSELLAAALRQHDRDVELQVLSGIGHGGPDALRQGWDATAPFFQRHLGGAA
jgi:dipeptidyl aminopeptidase/acylaminoacyl peptidase